MVTMLDCIERIPLRLTEILGRYPEQAKRLAAYFGEKGIRKVGRLVFIASGSSYNSAHTAELFLKNRCKILTELKYPNIYVNYEADMELAGEESGCGSTVYVVISQGGETRLAYQALEKIKSAGKPCIAITADEGSSIARLADFYLEMGSGQEEFLYRTVGFSTSVAACWMLGIAAGVYNKAITPGQEEGYLEDFRCMARNLPEMERGAEDWYRKHKFSLLRRGRMMLAGTGDLYPIANEGDIKFMEMVPMMTRSFELEEFIHGPQNCFDGDTLFLILHHKGEDDEKAAAIARFIKEQIGFCAVVGEEPLDGRDLCITPASRFFFALEYVTVLQVLAYRMADGRGRDLTRGVNAVIGRYIKKTL